MKAKVSLFCSALALLIALSGAQAYAQMSDKELKKELRERVDRDSKKSAKELTKEGWKVMPGKLPLEKQIAESKYTELDEDEGGEKRFFMGTHQAVGGNYTAAKQIADNRARVELAQSVYTAIAQKIEDQVANTDFGEGDMATIDEFVSANKSIVAAQLQGVVPVLEIYREKSKGQFEVRVMVTIEAQKALKAAKMGYYNELKNKSQKLADELDAILGY